ILIVVNSGKAGGNTLEQPATTHTTVYAAEGTRRKKPPSIPHSRSQKGTGDGSGVSRLHGRARAVHRSDQHRSAGRFASSPRPHPGGAKARGGGLRGGSHLLFRPGHQRSDHDDGSFRL